MSFTILALALLTLDKANLEGWVKQSQAQNQERLDRLRTLFTEVGCQTTEQKVNGSKLPNLICEIPGPDDAIILVGAHYDKVKNSDGVIDNWTGATLLPALYEALKATPHQHKIIFIGFADEEKGLIGSTHYSAKIKKQDRPQYQAMINIDSLGTGPVNIWSGRNDPRLTEILNDTAVALNVEIGSVNLDKVGMGDSFPFHAMKFRTLDFHSITPKSWPLLHTPKDNLAALHLDDYWESYQLISAFLTRLDQELTRAQAKLR